MPIPEQDALRAIAIAKANPNDPAVIAKAQALTRAYQAQQEAAGLSMFPEQERRRDEQASTLRSFFTEPNHGLDEDTLLSLNENFRESPDEKFKLFNRKWFEAAGVPRERVEREADELMKIYSEREWGTPSTTHKHFFDRIARDYQTREEVANAAKETSLQNLGVLRSELAFKERFRENSSYVGREQKWDKEFQSLKERFDQDLAPHRSTVKLLSAALMTKEGVGVEDPKTMDEALAQRREIDNAPSYRELAEIVMMVPAEDRKLVIAAAVAASANDEAGRKSVMEGLVEMFDRGVKDFTEGIPSQGERLWAIGLKNQIKAGFPVSAEDAATPEAFLAAASSSMKAGISAGLTPMGDIVPAPAIEEPGDVSEEVKSGALALADRLIEAIDLRGELRNAAENEIDPITSDFVAMRGLYATARSIPYMAASFLPGGLLLNAGALQEQSYQQLRAANPTMSAEQAQLIASIGGPFQAYVERLQGKLALGQLKSVNRFFNQITRTKGAVASRFLTRTAATAGAEMFQENVQDLTPFAIQGLLSALDEDMPEVPWEPVYGDLLKQQPELFFAVLPLAVIGGGAGTYSDFKGGAELLTSYDLLRATGLSEAAASEVRALASQGNVEGAQTLLRQEFKTLGQDQKSVQEARAEAIPRMIAEREAMQQALNDAGELDILPAILREGEKYTLRYTGGEAVQYDSHAEAFARFEAVASSAVAALHEDMITAARMTTSQIERGREVKFIVSPLRPTTEDMEAQGVATGEDMAQRMEISEADKALTPKTEERKAKAMAGMVANSPEARTAVNYILGSATTADAAPDSFGDRVVRNTVRLYQGATPFTLFEETAEGDAKFMIRELGLRRWMIGALRQWEATSGDALFRASIKEESEIKDQDIVEAYSKMVQGYLAGRSKSGDQGRVFSSRFRKSIADALRGDFGAVLTGYASLFEAVYRRAAMIEKARRDGTFDGDLETFLAKSTGMSEQRLFERDVQREGSAIAQDLSGNPDFSSGDGTETTFSVIERGQGFKQTVMPDGMVLEGPATFSVLAHHGTPHKVDRFQTRFIGTGEGAQAYGWGLYFAEAIKVAIDYKNQLGGVRLRTENSKFADELATTDGSKKILREARVFWKENQTLEEFRENLKSQRSRAESWAKQGQDRENNSQFVRDVDEVLNLITNATPVKTGNLYTVELLPDEGDFLDWDKPLSEQSEKVQAALQFAGLVDLSSKGDLKLTGSDIYGDAGGSDSQQKSSFLFSLGIPGIRYLDGNSRADGTGSYNYVIFDESLIRILEENGQPVEQQGGETTFSVITASQDRDYLDAVERDMETAQRMVDEAARAAGYGLSHRRKGKKSPKNTGYVVLFAENDNNYHFGENNYVVRLSDLEVVPDWVFEYFSERGFPQSEVDPKDIVETAGVWDSAQEVSDFWQENESRLDGILGFRTQDGAVVFDSYSASIKSADPVTYDESGNVIPLSQRFNPARDEITYSLLPDASNLDTEFARMFSPFHRSPELRAKLVIEMRRRGAEQVTKLRPILRANRTKGSIEAERKRRQDEIFTEKLDTLSAGEIQALANENLLEDNSLTPILAELLREKTYLTKSGKRVRYWTGSLMSKSEANRRGYDTTGGEWDAVPEGLPPYVYGGSITPDEAATMFDFETPEAFFDALASEIQSRGDRKQEVEDAKRRVRELEKEARQEARAWADEAMKERKTVGGDRAVLLGFLRTLDAITRALPAEVRGKIGGSVALAKLVTPAAMLDEIESRVERIDKELERYLKKEADDRRKALFETAKPKREAGKKPKGKAGADIHDLFDRLKEALLWDGDQAEAWATMLEDRIGKGELSAEAEAHAKIEANLVRLFSDWKNADAARRTAAVDAGEEVWRVGYLAEKERIAKERERRAEIRAEIIAGTGKLGSRSERVVKAQQDAGLSGQWKEWFLSLFNFAHVAGFAMGDDSKWTLWFSDAQREAEAKKLDEVQAVLDGLDELFRELGGSRLGGEKLQWKLSQPSFETKAGGKMSELQGITALLMWRQEDGKRHMQGKRDENGKIVSAWSYDETFIAEIEKNLSTEALAVMDYLTDQYAGEYETLNPIFRELNGINLPRNDKYSPLTVKPQQAPGGQTTDPVTGSTMSNGSMTPGSLRTRAQVVAEPDFRNAVEVFVGHKKQLAHWKAYAVFSRDAQAILGNREVGNAIEAASGQEAAKVLRSWLDLFAQGGVRDAGSHLALTKALGAATGRASAVQLVGRLGTLAIQTAQLGAAAAKMPVRDYIVRLSKLLTGNLGWGEALNSPYIQRRLAQMPASVQVAMEGLRAGKPNMIKHAAQRVGRLISGTDALFTAGTYAMVFDYQLTKATRAGVDPVTAAEIARNEAERIVDEVAQPTRQGTRSLFEATATNPLGRVAWAFASEARKNMALVAYTGGKRPSGDLARALLYVIVFNGVLSALIRTAWRDLRDDEEDEDEWGMRRILLSVGSEPLYGFPGFGEIAQDAIFAAAGEWKPSGSILDAPVKAPAAIVRAPENFGMVLEGDFEQPLRDLETMLMAGGLFNDTIAGLASFSHVLRDAESLIRNFIPDTP